MNQKKFDELMTGFLASDHGEKLMASIVMRSVATELMREIEMEDGSSEPGKIVHKKITVNLLDHLAGYMPRIEAAIRGCQSDAAQARNRAANTRDLLLGICRAASDQGLELLPGDKRQTPKIERIK